MRSLPLLAKFLEKISLINKKVRTYFSDVISRTRHDLARRQEPTLRGL